MKSESMYVRKFAAVFLLITFFSLPLSTGTVSAAQNCYSWQTVSNTKHQLKTCYICGRLEVYRSIFSVK
jgi:hypothetical protein